MPFHNIISTTSGGGSGDTFDTIQPDAGTSPVASGASTLTLTSSDASVTITGNAGTDTIDFVVVSGSGDVTGPASSTDNAIVRFDGLTGKLIQNSVGTLSDAGLLSTANVTVTSLTTGSVVFSASGALSQDNASFFWDNTDKTLITGDPGSEGSGINLNGSTYISRLKVSDIGGTTPAQFILHRHSTTIPSAIIASRSNSDTSSHAAVTAGQQLFFLSSSGWTGSHYDTFGILSFVADSGGTVSSTSSPGRIDLWVAPDGSDSPAIGFSLRQNKIIEMPAYGTGIAHFSSSGVISSSTIVNADVSASAAIAITKIANGTANQLIKANAGATANEFATLSGGTGLSVTFGAGTIALANTGVTSIVAGTAIGVSGATGAVTVNNTGVTSIVAGTGISISGGTGAVTVNSTITQYTDELAQDAVGTILTDSSTIDFTYNDGANTITAAVIANTSTQKVEITKNSGAVVGTRKQLNFIEGTNVTLTVADDAGNDQVDITIAATGASGAPSTATYVTLSTDATLTNERVLTGTASQITVTDNGAGSTVVLSTPQNIATGSSPTFTGLTLSGLTNTRVVYAGVGGVLSGDADFTFDSTNNRLSILNIAGSATAAGDLTLEPNSTDTDGTINLDGRIEVFSSQPNIGASENTFMYNPTFTANAAAGAVIHSWFNYMPTYTVNTNVAAIHENFVMAINPIVTFTQSLSLIYYAFYHTGTFTSTANAGFANTFSLFVGTPTMTSSTAAVPPINIGGMYQAGATFSGGNAAVGSTFCTNFTSGGTFQTTGASGSMTISAYIGYQDQPNLKANTSGGALTISSRRAFYFKNFSNTVTGTVTLTDNVGFDLDDQTASSGNLTVTNLYGIRSALTSGTNRFFIFHSGSADSVHTGELRLGDTTAPTALLDIIGKMTMDTNGLVTRYNDIATVSKGIPSILATVDLTAQAAAIATTTLYAVPASGAGVYRVNWYAKLTRAATTSSVMGALTITFTDPSGVAVTMTAAGLTNAGAIATTRTTNSTTNTGVLNGVPLVINANASTNIQYAMAYTSVGATTMQYTLRIKVEAL